MNTIFLSIGSNIGDRGKNILISLEKLSPYGAFQDISSLWETKAWGNKKQPDFYNILLKMTSKLEPEAFLEKIHEIEIEIGRVREKKWEKRIIDIDIIFWNQENIHTDKLIIPHEYAHKRAFVLAPLLEMEPQFSFPDGVSAESHWNALSEKEKNSVFCLFEEDNSVD